MQSPVGSWKIAKHVPQTRAGNGRHRGHPQTALTIQNALDFEPGAETGLRSIGEREFATTELEASQPMD
jgi:hypothetical protein